MIKYAFRMVGASSRIKALFVLPAIVSGLIMTPIMAPREAVAAAPQVGNQEIIDNLKTVTGLTADTLNALLKSSPKLFTGIADQVVFLSIVNKFYEARDAEALRELVDWVSLNLAQYVSQGLVPTGFWNIYSAFKAYSASLTLIRDLAVIPALDDRLYQNYKAARMQDLARGEGIGAAAPRESISTAYERATSVGGFHLVRLEMIKRLALKRGFDPADLSSKQRAFITGQVDDYWMSRLEAGLQQELFRQARGRIIEESWAKCCRERINLIKQHARTGLWLQVVDKKTGAPLQEARVDASSGGFVESQKTSAAGQVLFMPLPPGLVNLVVSAPGYQTRKGGLEIKLGVSNRPPAVALTPLTGRIQVMLQSMGDHKPITGNLLLTSKAGYKKWLKGSTVLFPEVPVGEYSLKATSPGFRDGYRHEIRVRADALNAQTLRLARLPQTQAKKKTVKPPAPKPKPEPKKKAAPKPKKPSEAQILADYRRLYPRYIKATTSKGCYTNVLVNAAKVGNNLYRVRTKGECTLGNGKKAGHEGDWRLTLGDLAQAVQVYKKYFKEK